MRCLRRRRGTIKRRGRPAEHAACLGSPRQAEMEREDATRETPRQRKTDVPRFTLSRLGFSGVAHAVLRAALTMKGLLLTSTRLLMHRRDFSLLQVAPPSYSIDNHIHSFCIVKPSSNHLVLPCCSPSSLLCRPNTSSLRNPTHTPSPDGPSPHHAPSRHTLSTHHRLFRPASISRPRPATPLVEPVQQCSRPPLNNSSQGA